MRCTVTQYRNGYVISFPDSEGKVFLSAASTDLTDIKRAMTHTGELDPQYVAALDVEVSPAGMSPWLSLQLTPKTMAPEAPRPSQQSKAQAIRPYYRKERW